MSYDETWSDDHASIARRRAALRRESDEVCRCRETLVDYVARTVSHPYTACPFHGRTTPLTAEGE